MPSTTRRFFLQGLLGLGLSGCAGGGPTLRLFSQAAQDIRGEGPARYPLTRAQIESIPYATLGVRVGEAASVVMVLEKQTPDGLVWLSADRVALFMHGGRLLRTAGMPCDLTDTRWVGSAPRSLGADASSGGEVERIVDLKHPAASGLHYRSTFSVIGDEKIEILEREYTTVHVREAVEVTESGWRFANEYWLDAKDGFVWRSLQRYCKEVPVTRFEVLKPATPLPA